MLNKLFWFDGDVMVPTPAVHVEKIYPSFCFFLNTCFPSQQNAAHAVELSLSPLAHEVPVPPSLPHAADWSSEAQRGKRAKNTQICLTYSRLFLPTASERNDSWDPTLSSFPKHRYDTVDIAVYENAAPLCQLCLMGCAAKWLTAYSVYIESSLLVGGWLRPILTWFDKIQEKDLHKGEDP